MDRLYESIFRCETNTAPQKLCLTAAVFSGTFLLTHTFLRFLRRKKPARNLPPGLPSIPFIGSMPFMPELDRIHLFFMEKSQEIGPVVSFYFPNRLAVILNGKEMIHEAFVKQSLTFASRPSFYTFDFLNPKLKGFLDHPYDSDFRRYHQQALNILKKFGFGKGIMETRIQVEVEDLLVSIRKLNGSAICADHLITTGVSNVIVSIILGERYDHSSPVLADLIGKAHEFVCFTRDLSVVDFLPIIRFLPKYRSGIKESIRVHDAILEHMSRKIDAGVQGELPESFITHFLEMEGPDFDRDQLLFTLRDLYLAGTETSATTLQWALIFLANNPDIQQRLHTEIDSVVPRERLPSLDDRRRLPFTEAVILELLRIKTVVPFALPHETLDDTHLNGYFIPKGTMVMANLYSAHMDPNIWKDPHTFNPQRFLDADGSVANKEMVISFSMGRRSCLGEILAQQEIFLFLTALVQHFESQPPEGQSTVDYKEFVGITLSPTSYKVRLLPRFK